MWPVALAAVFFYALCAVMAVGCREIGIRKGGRSRTAGYSAITVALIFGLGGAAIPIAMIVLIMIASAAIGALT